MTLAFDGVYHVSMDLARVDLPAINHRLITSLTIALTLMFHAGLIRAEEFPLTRNVPIPDFQNRAQDAHQYNFDAPPEGMFRSIVLSESFE